MTDSFSRWLQYQDYVTRAREWAPAGAADLEADALLAIGDDARREVQRRTIEHSING